MRDTKAILLAAAVQEFAKRGLHGTRIQAIASQSGLNERMIYVHFGSKEGLYMEVLKTQLAILADRWSAVVREVSVMEPYEGMRHALGGFFDAIIDQPLLVSLLLHEALDGWRAVPSPTTEMLPAALAELYERGQREEVFCADRPFEVAYGIVMSALMALPVYLPRFAELIKGEERATGAGDLGMLSGPLRDQVVAQLLDGMCTHRQRERAMT